MSINWVEIVLGVLVFVAAGVGSYFKAKGNVTTLTVELIKNAETIVDAIGKEKMAMVVAGLADYVPSFLKGIITRERLENWAQSIFDNMRKYADNYIANVEQGDEE